MNLSSLGQNNDQSYLASLNAKNDSMGQDSGNWFTHLLPTIGSMAAWGLGGLLAPETGGLSLLGSAAIQGAGSAVGKGAENALEGQDLLNGVPQAAMEGGAGGLVGGLAGGLISKGAGAASKVAQGAQDAANVASQGAQDIANQQAVRDAWMGVSPKLRQNLNLGNHVDTINGLGLDATNPQHFVSTADQALDTLGRVRDEALSSSGPVDMSNFNDTLHGVLSNPETANVLGAYRDARGMPMNTPAAKIYSAVQNAGAGVLNAAEADPNAAQQVLTRIQGLAADAKPTLNAQGVIDPTQKAVYNTYTTVANKLKDALYNRPEVDEAFAKVPGNLRAEDVGGNQALADRLNETLNNAKSAQDVLTPMSNYINMGKLGKAGLQANQDVASAASVRQVKAANGVSSSKIATDVPGMNTLNSGPFGISPGTMAMLGLGGAPFTGGLSALGAVPEALKIAGQHPEVLQGAANIAGKVLPPAAMIGANVLTHGSDFATPQASTQGDLQGDTMQPQQSNGLDPSMIPQLAKVAAIQAAMNGDMSGIGQLQSIIAPPQATAANNAATALQGLQQAYQQAGGGQGFVGGNLASLGGTFGGPARAYNDAMEQVATQIAQATGDSPASVKSRLPQLTDEPGTAQTKLDNIMSLIKGHYNTATQSGYPTSGMGGAPFGLSSVGG